MSRLTCQKRNTEVRKSVYNTKIYSITRSIILIIIQIVTFLKSLLNVKKTLFLVYFCLLRSRNSRCSVFTFLLFENIVFFFSIFKIKSLVKVWPFFSVPFFLNLFIFYYIINFIIVLKKKKNEKNDFIFNKVIHPPRVFRRGVWLERHLARDLIKWRLGYEFDPYCMLHTFQQ